MHEIEKQHVEDVSGGIKLPEDPFGWPLPQPMPAPLPGPEPAAECSATM